MGFWRYQEFFFNLMLSQLTKHFGKTDKVELGTLSPCKQAPEQTTMPLKQKIRFILKVEIKYCIFVIDQYIIDQSDQQIV